MAFHELIHQQDRDGYDSHTNTGRERNQANHEFNNVQRLVPPDSAAARRAHAGLRGEQPVPPPAETAPPAPATPKGGGKR